jgi:hypothetical protein
MYTPSATLPLPFASAPVARFAGAFGYRLEGDQLELNADLAPMADAADALSLQLWACDDSGRPEHAVKVGECPVAPVAGARGWSEALPPAGAAARTLVMALTANGLVQDLVTLPMAQAFVQPRISGCCGYRFDGDQVELGVEAVENPRSADNLSGDLSLELWALAAPYAGGAFEGVRVAQATLGRLGGEQRFADVALRVPATRLPAGRRHLALMLREWSAGGYVTRDYSNFAQPCDMPAETPAETPVESPAAPATAAVAAEPVSASTPVEAPRAAAKPEPKAKASPAAAKASPAPAKANPAKAKEVAAVSINTATVDALASVKGLSRTVARAIVAGRPYTSVDELVRVKGLGEKTLAKVRAALKR